MVGCSQASKLNNIENTWPQQRRGWGRENKFGVGTLDVCHRFYFSLGLLGAHKMCFSCLLVRYQQLEARGAKHHPAASWHWRGILEPRCCNSLVLFLSALQPREILQQRRGSWCNSALTVSAEGRWMSTIYKCSFTFRHCPERSEVSGPATFCSCQGLQFPQPLRALGVVQSSSSSASPNQTVLDAHSWFHKNFHVPNVPE